ncbi:L-2-hydroxyglutarate oxidase [uncultured Sanguibacteroides sp.]|uniref:L-2-hydroxyglutarate oxidase n=1 Tax=uncultured Sanguibacteroides sp. TaxID=1635151 RepID=UPI0025EE31DE|nr:L-2-hydroxyglutarate oxidase [uncultured Sanguibacteroides sp.]
MEIDYLIIGAGIIGLATAKELRVRFPESSIAVLEKETDVAFHSSGRNSGVLHAGFYYTADSLKAKFTKEGNALMHQYCYDHRLRINECRKVVVAQNEEELKSLFELQKRGEANGVDVKLITAEELKEIDPNVVTYKYALYSPTTATVDPVEICNCLKQELQAKGVQFFFNEAYCHKCSGKVIETVSGKQFSYKKLINAAGLYADKVAKDFGFSRNYTIIPFKGIYLKYMAKDKPIKVNVYPVPNLRNPFLGVHYTITVDNIIKIGPTSIPAFWRENYKGFNRFRFDELVRVLFWEAKLFLLNSFGFRSLALEEIKKYNKKYFCGLASKMVNQIDRKGFNEWSKPGIRAQLLNTETNKLEMDFVVEGDKDSIHILNAVSPAFTASFPFTKWVVEHYVLKNIDK